MRIHVVGGFLGSGKTTAIRQAAAQLTAQGQRVGIITNDQGQYLVDTAFFRAEALPTGEVTGGCFCCNYDDLDAQINTLQNSTDVIFAETVGSCADLVATVIKPLQRLRHDSVTFSVFADVRLFRAWLRGDLLPLSDDIGYIFGKQIEEAGLLVLNKADLLTPAERSELQTTRLPDQQVRLQNSLDAADVAGWVALLDTAAVANTVLDIDYDRYGAGEAQLAWLDEAIVLAKADREAVIRIIRAIVQAVRQQNLPVGHLKFFAQGGTASCKISFTTLDQAGWEAQIPALAGESVQLLINARVEVEAQRLRELVHLALERAQQGQGWTYAKTSVDVFHPGFPRPTHRIRA